MGMFAEAAKGDTEEETTVPGGAPAPEEREAPEPEAPPEPVAVAIPKPPSRRAQAAEALKADYEAKVRAVEERTSRELSETRAALARMQADIASRPVHVVAPQQQAAPEADPDELMREAEKALDNKDLTTYHRKLRESHLAATRREMAPRFAQQQQYQPQQQMDPQLIALLAEFPDVANAENGIQLAIIEDARLNAHKVAPGPARVRAAFAEVRRQFSQKNGGGQQRPSYDQGAAGVLGSAPTSRGSGASNANSGEPALMMSPDEERSLRSIAKKAQIPWGEYIADYARANPHMVRGR